MSGIDAARGTAMLFSCLAHYGWWIGQVHPRAAQVLTGIGMIATPTFLLLSGTVTGWLCATASRDPLQTRLKLVNRGLFLLTFGHLLISLAEAHRDGGILHTFTGATIIDDIGLCMLCCALWFPALRHRDFRHSLVGYGIAGYLLCWLLILAWHPPVGGWLALHQALLGADPLGSSMHSYASPTLPYACLFAIGLGMSDYILAAARENALSERRNLLVLGGALIFCALLCHGLRLFLDHAFSRSGALPFFDASLSVRGKLPPAPVYVLAYGGAGMFLSAALFTLASSRSALATRITSAAAVVGRTSLFVFVLQYFVYWTLPDLVGFSPKSRYIVLIFIFGLCLNWLAAYGWDRIHGNRFLTLGIERRRQPQVRGGTDQGSPRTSGH